MGVILIYDWLFRERVIADARAVARQEIAAARKPALFAPRWDDLMPEGLLRAMVMGSLIISILTGLMPAEMLADIVRVLTLWN